MKIGHMILPAYASVYKPETARNLLRLLAFALVVGVYIGAYSFLRVTLNQEVSLRRSYMNEAVFNAQRFFVSRKTLLQMIVLSTVGDANSDIHDDHGEQLHFVLGDAQNQWSLWLTKRMLAHLRKEQNSLIYVPASESMPVKRFLVATEYAQAVPMYILRRLREIDTHDDITKEEYWLSDPEQPDSPIYIFIRLDVLKKNSGWLGLEVDGPHLIQAIQHEQAGAFQLLDTSGLLILSNTPLQQRTPLDAQSAPNRTTASFGWEGGQWLPDSLTIRKQLDYSDWQIVYRLKLLSLLPALSLPLSLCLLICIVFTGLMLWLVRRVEQRLIAPAAARIDALVESEAFCSAVIRIAPVALCVLRRHDGAVVLENHLSEQWLGTGDERADVYQEWIHRAFDSESTNHNVDEMQLADGRHLSLSYTPTRYQREYVLIFAFSDITTRKSAEMALQQARTLADAANEAKTLFLATMSHEIRTPLYGVVATLELLSRTQLDAQQRGYLKAIEGSSATLLQLICDMLDVSKIEAGQLALELSIFSPIELTQDVIQGYSGAAKTKGLQLFTCIDPSLSEEVLGDVVRVRQILGNLLSNAVKFTESGRIVVRLQVVYREGERTMLSWQVVDTGKGIPAEDHNHLFEPFFQSHPSANVVAGTGLGLSICKRLVHLMNGSLRVFSEPGLGSSFAFSLPLEHVTVKTQQRWALPLSSEIIYVQSSVQELAEHTAGWLRRWGARTRLIGPDAAQLDTDGILVELCPGPANTAQRADWPGRWVLVSQDGHSIVPKSQHIWHVGLNNLQALNRALSQAQGLGTHDELVVSHQLAEKLHLRLLVAEDNMINQLILRDQLEELGCTVVLARDGVEALAVWRDADFDIVITDVNMPKMNGYQLTQRLREQGCTMPIVGATANAMLDEAERCLSAGMDHFLVKPFTLQALYQCLQPYKRGMP